MIAAPALVGELGELGGAPGSVASGDDGAGRGAVSWAAAIEENIPEQINATRIFLAESIVTRAVPPPLLQSLRWRWRRPISRRPAGVATVSSALARPQPSPLRSRALRRSARCSRRRSRRPVRGAWRAPPAEGPLAH